MASRSKILRSGYTTGTCAAGAAKAAVTILLKVGKEGRISSEEAGIPGPCPREVDILLPDRKRVSLGVQKSGVQIHGSRIVAHASIIKDAGDDPDVTNGAEIVAEGSWIAKSWTMEPEMHIAGRYDLSDVGVPEMILAGGKGVGLVTKPGLPVPPGEAAINPVPRKMIMEAVRETLKDPEMSDLRSVAVQDDGKAPAALLITVSVTDGEELAKKTLNRRLGIIGGISILGTSGIVRPLSSEAWTASITSSMDVAKALHLQEVVLSAGRASEKAHMKEYHFPEEAYVMMGDYLEFSLLDAVKHGFARIHLCAQWAKMLKIAQATPQTHVRHGAIETGKSVDLLNRLGIPVPRDREFNTARELFEYLLSGHGAEAPAFRKVCSAAKRYAEGITRGIPVKSHLVSYNGEIIAASE